ncbi:TetR/AcrR family transcriptional regulator [Microbacterium aurum]
MATDDEAGTARLHLSADERRRLLTEAALQVMKREGVKAATTRAICAEAGMPHGAFHYCFRSKQELYTALFSTDINVDLDQAWATIDNASSIHDSIYALMIAYWRTVEHDPQAQIVLTELTTLGLRDPALQELPAWEQSAYRDRLIAHLRRFASHADVDYAIPVERLAEMILAALSGLTTSWLSTRDDDAAQDAIREFANIFSTYTARRAEQ